MKRKDITVGTDYAYALYGVSRHRSTDEYFQRATVVEMGTPSNGGVSNVVVRYDGTLRSVPLRKIIRTWAEHETNLAARRASTSAAIERMRADVAAIREIIPAGEDSPLSKYQVNDEVHADGSFGTLARLSYSDLREVVEAAFQAGRRNALDGF